MIDQTTLGHRAIKQQFNKTPRAGWQIDPFGHSAVQAYLLGAELGFDSVHFARIDYQDRAKRKGDKSLEVIWRGSRTFGSSSQANVTRTNHIMWTMGDDFQYQYARSWFKQMDKLIHYVNKDGRVNALYSTPSIYTDAKNAANQSWPLKTDDYFPRPGLKGYVRSLSGYYLAARELEFLIGKRANGSNTYTLGDALGIVQHHDAVTGTAKQHTTNDYAKRLSIGAFEAEAVVSSALSCLTKSKSGDQCKEPTSTFSQVTIHFGVAPCFWISWCPFFLDKLIFSKIAAFNKMAISNLVVVAYNPLGWNRTEIVRIPVRKNGNGFLSVMDSPQNETIEVGPGDLKMSFSFASGQLKRMYNSKTGVDVPIQQSYLWYGSSKGDTDSQQASGAYIFRPNGSPATIVSRSVPLKVFRGPLVDEIHQQFSSWIYQVTRLYKDKEHAEVEYTIGPIPTEDGVGKEVITRMTANMETNKVFYTDSNGRDFIKRVRDYRPDWPLSVNQPVAGNYYPLNLGIYTLDKKSEFSVLVDRATGGSSIEDGEVELMLHRRTLYDDSRGVGEALDEIVCAGGTCEGLTVRGNYYMCINQVGAGAPWRRTTGQEVYSPLLLAFTHEKLEDWTASHLTKASTMDLNYSLPLNVALITLQVTAAEDPQYSTLAKVELKKMFTGKMIKEVKEVSLSANQEKSEMKKMTWKVEGDNGDEPTPIRGGRCQ
ncbi:hypothetical protein GBA52_023244 [Prunus armeniaca]|nr:hypothetical protein GBA52_023244 [Prunus armeniaca]